MIYLALLNPSAIAVVLDSVANLRDGKNLYQFPVGMVLSGHDTKLPQYCNVI